MTELGASILRALPPSGAVHRDQLWTLTAQTLGSPIPNSEFEGALSELVRALEVAIEGGVVRRITPDFPERQLEDLIQDWLFGDDLFCKLKLRRESTVCQKTAVGGRSASGIWSRPDFTIATIRSRKYDPLRHLDVLAFELKNVAGTNVVAVHEALAHTRFANYAYLVCPRPASHEEKFASIQSECSAHGVGLLSFRLGVCAARKPQIGETRVELLARRREPDPDIVDEYLDGRLSQQNCTRLSEIARSG